MESQPYLSPSFNELVFEQRHKQYGAYVLRRSYNRTLIFAVSLSCATLLLFGFGSSALAGNNPKEDEVTTQHVVITTPPDFKKPDDKKEEKKVEQKEKNIVQKGPKQQEKTTINVTDSIFKQDTTHYVSGPPKDPHGTDTTGIAIGDPKKPNDTTGGPPTGDPLMPVTFCDQEPTCAGLQSYLLRNTHYPEFCKDQGIQGTVMLEFMVDIDGTIKDLKVAKSAHKLLDKEAMRVAAGMPTWTPCSTGGVRARYIFHMPIKFRLQ